MFAILIGISDEFCLPGCFQILITNDVSKGKCQASFAEFTKVPKLFGTDNVTVTLMEFGLVLGIHYFPFIANST